MNERRWIRHIEVVSRYDRSVSEYDILCQSCGIDGDLDIIANIAVAQDSEVLHKKEILINPKGIKYLTPFKKASKCFTDEEYANFIKLHWWHVQDLILSLLEPGELDTLEKARPDMPVYGTMFADRVSKQMMFFGSLVQVDGPTQGEATVAKLKQDVIQWKTEGGKYPELIREYERLDSSIPVYSLTCPALGQIHFHYRNATDLVPLYGGEQPQEPVQLGLFEAGEG